MLPSSGQIYHSITTIRVLYLANPNVASPSTQILNNCESDKLQQNKPA